MKFLAPSVVGALFFASHLASQPAEQVSTEEIPRVTIGVVLDGPWDQNGEVEAVFQEELRILTDGEFMVSFPASKRREGDWSVGTTERNIDSLLNDPDVDILVTIGGIASHVATSTGPHVKPVMAPFVIDGTIQDAPLTEDGTSGVGNLAYLTPSQSLARDLEVFRGIRDFEHLAVLVTGEFYEAIPRLREPVESIVSAMGKRFTIIPVVEVSTALSALPGDVDAVYIYPLLRLGRAEFRELVDGLIARRLPSFSRFGSREVSQGILASLTDVDIQRRARRVALYIQRALLGEDASTFLVEFEEREQVVINMATARAIQVYPSFALMTVAELLDPERVDVDQVWTLPEAIDEAVRVNLILASQIQQTAAGAENIRQARSVFFPQLDVGADAQVIDKDRAETIGNPERVLSPFIGAEQLLFSEPAFANLAIQKDLQASRVWEEESLRLDTIQEAATAYLNILRSLTFERVQRNNLDLSRSNLQLARVRRDLGVSGPAEVFRWESEIATDRSELIASAADRNLAQIALNRLLHRPLEESFRTEEIGLEDSFFAEIETRFSHLIADQWRFRVFRSFLVDLGNEVAPELQILNANIEAQERALSSAQRAFFSPTAALQWTLSRPTLGGASSSGLGAFESLGALFPEVTFAQPGDWDWTLGLNVSLPLFTGGNRRSIRDQESLTLEALRLQRNAVSEQIEQRIRSAMHQVAASYAAIGLSRDAASAAQQNLELVTDSYSRGVVSILDLLDAQNASLSASSAAANSVYDFLIVLLEAQRAVGSFSFLDTDEERRQFEDRLIRFFAREGIELGE